MTNLQKAVRDLRAGFGVDRDRIAEAFGVPIDSVVAEEDDDTGCDTCGHGSIAYVTIKLVKP